MGNKCFVITTLRRAATGNGRTGSRGDVRPIVSIGCRVMAVAEADERCRKFGSFGNPKRAAS
jgi:hypothetical protein